MTFPGGSNDSHATVSPLALASWATDPALLRLLLDDAPAQIWLADAECRGIYGNRRAYEALGLAPGTNLSPGAAIRELPDGLRFEAGGRELLPGEMPLQLAAQTGEPIVGFEHELIHPDGRRQLMSMDAVPIVEAGTVRGVIGVCTDITARKQAEASLGEADRRKDRFLAILAHELRNPLAAMRNALRVLQSRGSTSADATWCRDVLDRQVEHMSRLLDDLLDVSRIVQNRVDVRHAPVELGSILNSALSAARPLLADRDIQLVVDIPRAPLYVEGDRVRLAQVFSNVINNAVKYSRNGGRIAVTVNVERPWVSVSVADDGIGITAEMLPRVFDLFIQEHRAVELSQGGLGIGLSLARTLVELQGGTITAESDGADQGATFTVRLPFGRRQPARHDVPVSLGTASKLALRVLVVDDNRDAADSLVAVLGVAGHRALAVYRGEDAIREVEAKLPDVILLDLGMPKPDGFAVCRHVRQLAKGSGVTIVAVSGWGRDEDLQRTREAGFDRHFLKPIDPRAVIAYLSTMQPHSSLAPAAALADGAPQRPRR